VSGYVAFLVMLGGPVLLAIWLAQRDRASSAHWGDQPSQNSVMGGAELEMPRILPVEPIEGPLVNRAPVTDTSHEQVLSAEVQKQLGISLEGSTG
jgi:hypothetical protein